MVSPPWLHSTHTNLHSAGEQRKTEWKSRVVWKKNPLWHTPLPQLPSRKEQNWLLNSKVILIVVGIRRTRHVVLIDYEGEIAMEKNPTLGNMNSWNKGGLFRTKKTGCVEIADRRRGWLTTIDSMRRLAGEEWLHTPDALGGLGRAGKSQVTLRSDRGRFQPWNRSLRYWPHTRTFLTAHACQPANLNCWSIFLLGLSQVVLIAHVIFANSSIVSLFCWLSFYEWIFSLLCCCFFP